MLGTVLKLLLLPLAFIALHISVCGRRFLLVIITMAVNGTVLEIITTEALSIVCLSRSLKMVPFSRSYTTFYLSTFILYHFRVI